MTRSVVRFKACHEKEDNDEKGDTIRDGKNASTYADDCTRCDWLVGAGIEGLKRLFAGESHMWDSTYLYARTAHLYSVEETGWWGG